MPSSIEQDIKEFHIQLEQASKLGKDIRILDKITGIIIAGMGASALPGDLLEAYANPQVNIPIITNRNYYLPKSAGKDTLVFVVSYSGNTEETISCFRKASGLGCKIVIVTSGGRLMEIAKKNNVPCVIVPKGLQPRAAVGYLLLPMLNILENSRIIKCEDDIKKLIAFFKQTDYSEKARELAERLKDKIPLIYSSDRLKGIAIRWKSAINENCKIHAFYNTFPELNHNELVGYTKLNGNYFAIFLSDEEDLPKIKDRIRLTKKIVSKQVPVTEIKLTGSNLLIKILSAVHLGDLISLSLAELYGVDPTPVEIIESFKKELGQPTK